MGICGECRRYTPNISGCWVSNLCQADMLDDDCAFWFRRVEPMHECHRPNDYQEVVDVYERRTS